MPYNDAMAEYLDHLICVEKSKVAVNGNKKEIEALMNMKSHHAKEVEILKEAMNKNDASLADSSTPLKMKELVNKLYALPINGPKFKPMVRVVDDARNAMNPQMNTFDITGEFRTISISNIKTKPGCTEGRLLLSSLKL